MFLPQSQAAELIRFASWADREARSDLAGGFLRDEDDYTSNFTGALRRIVNSNSHTGLVATSYMLETSQERRMGCDATIIITRGGVSKIAAFEAKWPRIRERYYRWDYAQTSQGLSHFSDQLERQSRLNSAIAVFEMFYCEFPFKQQPSWMQSEGSSCTWHSAAKRFDDGRIRKPPWTNDDLKSLLSNASRSIMEILTALVQCEEGDPVGMGGPGAGIAGEFGLEGPVLQVVADTEAEE